MKLEFTQDNITAGDYSFHMTTYLYDELYCYVYNMIGGVTYGDITFTISDWNICLFRIECGVRRFVEYTREDLLNAISNYADMSYRLPKLIDNPDLGMQAWFMSRVLRIPCIHVDAKPQLCPLHLRFSSADWWWLDSVTPDGMVQFHDTHHILYQLPLDTISHILGKIDCRDPESVAYAFSLGLCLEKL